MTELPPVTDHSNAIPNSVDQILATIRLRGGSWYAGEAVTQSEHALQTAKLAEQNGASDELITAALLHDYGHLIHSFDENCANNGIDDQHEFTGAKELSLLFGPNVTEPIRLHVSAKRYLCAVNPTYLISLSAASITSLQLQGGPFDIDAIRDFENNPHFMEVVQLRTWDDEAKISGLCTESIEYYRAILERSIRCE